jgi:hypothetical protein
LIGDGQIPSGLTDTITGDALLGPLDDNGGPTHTHALLSESPAINAGDNAAVPDELETDQRGPGFESIARGRVDIGAFEVQNTAPTPADDLLVTNEDTKLVVTAPGLLGNDSDPDGDALSISSIISGPSHGILTFSADGSISYSPAKDFAGTDSFVYQVSDGFGGLASATVTVRVISAEEQLENLLKAVEDLRGSRVLNSGQANALGVKVQNAQEKLGKGQGQVASTVLGAFINQVRGFIKAGILSGAQGQSLIGAAEAAMVSILS